MSEKPIKVLVFAGSTRMDSYNKKLARIATSLCNDAGLETTYIDLKVYPLPLYDGDLEEEIILPENALKIRTMMQEHQGFVIACPEYNSSISGVLKNTIDWCSRPRLNEEPLVCFKNKIIALLSASPGNLGGLRGLVTVRSILGNIGSIVIPEQYSLNVAHEKFTADGYLKNEFDQKQVASVVNAFSLLIKKITV